MRVLILFDRPTPGARVDQLDGVEQAEWIAELLEELGHGVRTLGVDLHLAELEESLRDERPDLVFNLVESLGGHGRLIHVVPEVLDALGVPYTGSGAGAIRETSDKQTAKRRMRAAGLPTPASYSLSELRALPMRFAPGDYIVKSAWEDASIGLEEDSVVSCEEAEALAAEIERRLPALGGEGFAEAYVHGRELNLSLLGGHGAPDVLPAAEIVFEGYAPGRRRVVGYAAKWDPSSPAYGETVPCFHFPASDGALLERLTGLSRATYELFGLRGYARVDFRVDSEYRPFLLEVNANPCLSPSSGFTAALERAGISPKEAVRRILDDALAGARSTARGAGAPRARATAPSSALRSAATAAFREEVLASDAAAVRAIVASTGYFHEHEIAIAVELVEERLARGLASGYHFLFPAGADPPLGYACFGRIPCTDTSFDLYWIAVRGEHRGRGLGRELLAGVEQRVRALGGRRIFVETSSRELYEPTRGFYRAHGYSEVALLPDFYAEGDGKVVLAKDLCEELGLR